jgi:hypothetical protein
LNITEDEFLWNIQLTALFHVDEDVRRAAMDLNGHLLDYNNARDKKKTENEKNESNQLQN